MLPIAEIRFRDIADIRKRTFPDAFLAGLNPGVLLLHNRLFGQWLLIYKTTGWRRSVLLTPADPDAFIEAVSRYRSGSGH
jgi:hypothetical protein